ncbi:MAG: FIST C-terminal domain-containing protein [Planctomycetes bacterium]|nr:FIST C-terminal domain-containing protein [Planctomycetota bacterium]
MIAAVFELGGPSPTALPSVPWFDGDGTLVLAFGAPGRSPGGSLHALRTAFPRAAILGATTPQAYLDGPCGEGSLACAALRFEHTKLRRASVQLLRAEQSHQAGIELGSQLDHPDLQAVLLCADGSVLRSTSLLRGLGSSLPPGTVVAGGLALTESGVSAVLDNEGAHHHCIVAVGLYGPRVNVRGAVSKGWQRFGPRRRVTRASGPWVYELDERPVVRVYEEYLGRGGPELLEAALRMPIGLHDPSGGGAVAVRSVVGMDEHGIALSFSGEVPQGAEVQFLRARKQALIDGAARAAQRLARGMGEAEGRFVLAFGQRGRQLVLGLRAPEEIEAARAELPEKVSLIGGASAGALLARIGGEGELYGESFTLFEIAEV